MELTNTVSDHLAIASVPLQKWDTVYNPDIALQIGTVFPSLNKPFYKADTSHPGSPVKADEFCIPDSVAIAQMDQEQLLTKIDEISFVMDDLTLYLDTHEQDRTALQLFKNVLKARVELLGAFAKQYYPITQACILKQLESGNSDCYDWTKGGEPWEGVMNYVAV